MIQLQIVNTLRQIILIHNSERHHTSPRPAVIFGTRIKIEIDPLTDFIALCFVQIVVGWLSF